MKYTFTEAITNWKDFYTKKLDCGQYVVKQRLEDCQRIQPNWEDFVARNFPNLNEAFLNLSHNDIILCCPRCNHPIKLITST